MEKKTTSYYILYILVWNANKIRAYYSKGEEKKLFGSVPGRSSGGP